MQSCRPELALQHLLRSHAKLSTAVSALAVGRSWRFSAYSGPMQSSYCGPMQDSCCGGGRPSALCIHSCQKKVRLADYLRQPHVEMRHRCRADAARRSANPCWIRLFGAMWGATGRVAPEQVNAVWRRKQLCQGSESRTCRSAASAQLRSTGAVAHPSEHPTINESMLNFVREQPAADGPPAKNTRSQCRPAPGTCTTGARAPKLQQKNPLHSPIKRGYQPARFDMARPGY